MSPSSLSIWYITLYTNVFHTLDVGAIFVPKACYVPHVAWYVVVEVCRVFTSTHYLYKHNPLDLNLYPTSFSDILPRGLPIQRPRWDSVRSMSYTMHGSQGDKRTWSWIAYKSWACHVHSLLVLIYTKDIPVSIFMFRFLYLTLNV
jgi:hypothetical protein